MKSLLWLRKIVDTNYFSPFIGAITGIFSIFYGLRRLQLYPEETFVKLDLLNIVLITDEFETYTYLFRRDPTLAFLPFLFLFVGVFTTSSSFLLKPKSYYSFLLSRSSHVKIAYKHLKKNVLKKNFFYTFSFMVVLLFCSFALFGWEISTSLLIQIMLHTLLKILLLLFLADLAFVFLLIKNVGIAFLSVSLTILLLFLFDLQWENGNILLFYKTNYFLESIFILSLLYGNLSWWTTNKLKINYLE